MLRSLGGKSPQVHPTAFVSEFAYVVGDVRIGSVTPRSGRASSSAPTAAR